MYGTAYDRHLNFEKRSFPNEKHRSMKTIDRPPGSQRAATIKNVIRVSSGNFLEMYDFIVFGYYAAAIGHTFFPGHDPYASLMLSFMTFGAGFLMRPVGAVVLGAYIDRYGRRAGLLLTRGLMSVGTLTIACLPGYATLGLLAPLLILLSGYPNNPAAR